MQPAQPKPKPKPALKKPGQKFGAYSVPIRAPLPSTVPASSDVSASAAVKQQRSARSVERDKPPPPAPAPRRALRSTSSKGSRNRRGSLPGSRAASDKSSKQSSRNGSEPTSDSDTSDRGRPRRISVTSAASSVGPATADPDFRESTAESILGLWDVNRAQEKIAEKEVVRERKHRASQEGFQPSPPVVDDNVILRQRLSVSKWKGAVKAVGAVNKMGMLVKSRPPSAPTLTAGSNAQSIADVAGYANSVPAHLHLHAKASEEEWEARTMMPDFGMAAAEAAAAVDGKAGHAEKLPGTPVMANPLRKTNNVLQVTAAPAWAEDDESDLARVERLRGPSASGDLGSLTRPAPRTSSNLSNLMQGWNSMGLQAALSLSGELPAGAAAAAVAATTAEEKPTLSLFDKIRGKRRASVDSPMLPKAPLSGPTRLSLDGGSATSTRPQHDMSHTSTAVRDGISTDHTSTDSLQASDALITAALTENASMASQSFASDTDLIGVGSRRAGSQAGSEADSVASSSRLSSRPVAGWKGRMSSMLIRSSPGQPKPDKEAVKEILKSKKGKPSLNVLIPTTSLSTAGPRMGAASPGASRLSLMQAPIVPTAPRQAGMGRKARRASNLAQLAEQAGASFADALEGKQTAGEAVQAANGMESMRAVISTSLTARRWQSKTVSKALPALAPFVPRMLRDDLLTAQPHCLSGSLRSQPSELYHQRSSMDPDRCYIGSKGMEPRMDSFDGAVLICDITGFTQLTEQLSKQGPSGVEQLTKCMNNYFTKVIDLILLYDGDVMKFAGDSMIVAFSPGRDEKVDEDGGLKAATVRCLHCATHLVDKYGSMRMMPSGDVIAIPLAERLREKARAARAAAVTPSKAPASSAAIAPVVAEGAVAFAVAGAVHRHKTAATPSESGQTPQNRWHSAFSASSGIFSGSPSTGGWHRPKAFSAPNAADLAAWKAAPPLTEPSSISDSAAMLPAEPAEPAAVPAETPEQAAGAVPPAAEGAPVISLLQQVNHKLRLPGIFHRSASAREPHQSQPSAGSEARLSPHAALVGGPHLPVSQLPLADSSIGTPESPVSPSTSTLGHPQAHRSTSHQSLLKGMPSSGLASALISNRPPQLPKSASFMQVRPQPDRYSGELTKIGVNTSLPTTQEEPEEGMQHPQPTSTTEAIEPNPLPHATSGDSGTHQAQAELEEQPSPQPQTSQPQSSPPLASQPQTSQVAAELGLSLKPVKIRPSRPSSLHDPIPLPATPSGHQPIDAFHVHKTRLEPVKTRLAPLPHVPAPGWPLGLSSEAQGWTITAPGPVTEGAEALVDGVSDAGSSEAESADLPAKWGMLQAAKRALFRRKSQVHSSGPGSSPRGSGAALGQGPHWDVSHTKPAHSRDFSIGSGSLVQHSTGSMTSVGTHLGSVAGLGHVSATYSPLSHQGSLLRKDVDNQKNIRQADLNAVKRTPLSLKVTVGCGKVCLFYVGGCADFTMDGGVPRWEFFIGDRPHHPEPDADGRRPPIAQIASAEQYAQAGDVILSPEVAGVTRGLCSVDPLEGNNARLVSMSESLVRSKEQGSAQLEGVQYLAEFAELPRYVQARAVQILRMHVMGNVRQRIEAGHRDFVNEIRVCTCLFLGFPSLKKPKAAMAASDEQQGGSEDIQANEVAEVQAAVDLVQRQMRVYDGSFLQFRCDEKGFLSICAFGLPGKTHEDSPARAIQSALAIVEGMKSLGGQGCIGVTTGQLLCACVGSRIRAEYTVFGDSINLSARLMCKATAGLGDILCDYATHHMAPAAAAYTRLEPLVVKGKVYPVEVYSVMALRKPEGGSQSEAANGRRRKQRRAGKQGLAASSGPATMSTTRTRSSDTISKIKFKQMVGRQNEMQQVTERLTRLVQKNEGGIIVIEGEPGMGKTRLLEELEHESMGQRQSQEPAQGQEATPDGLPRLRKLCNVFVANGDLANKSKVLYPWRRIFQQMFNHDRMAGALYCMWDAADAADHAVVTELGARCRAITDDYASWQAILMHTLDMQEEDLPVAPTVIPGSMIHAPHEVHLHSSASGTAHGSPDHMGGTRTSQEGVESTGDSLTGRRRSVSSQIKRSSSVLLAALPSSGRWNGSSQSTMPQVLHSNGSVGSHDHSGSHMLDSSFLRPPTPKTPTSHTSRGRLEAADSLHSQTAMATTIRPRAIGQGQGRLGRSNTQESMQVLNAATHGHAWLEMSHELRAQRAKDLLLQVLREFVGAYGPLAIMLEDLHHFDTTSWSFLTTVVEHLSQEVLIVTTMRPNDGVLAAAGQHEEGKYMQFLTAQKCLKTIQKLPCYTHMVLQPFNMQEVRQYMCIGLDLEVVSDQTALAIQERTGGLPLYVEQAMLYLQQHDNLLREDRELGEQDLQAFSNIRVSIHHVITDRIDHLRPSQQLTLKVASVMGLNSVALDLLLLIHPMSASQAEDQVLSSSRQDLKNDMQELESAGFVKPCKETPDSWEFAQVLARDVAYDLIPFAQRRGLHARLAEALESTLPRAAAATIAFHYSKSCHSVEGSEWKRAVKAIQYWEMAAEEAMDGIDHGQAMHMFRKAESLLETMTKELDKSRVMANRPVAGMIHRTNSISPLTFGVPQTPGAALNPVSRVRHARWNRHMASMWMADGNVDTGRFHSLRALHILGAPLPVAEEVDSTASWLCCPCGAALHTLGRHAKSSLQTSGHSATNLRVSGASMQSTPAWLDKAGRVSHSDAGSLPSVTSDLKNEFKDHSHEERREAAAVLTLLLSAELQIEPPDPEAFRYILQTCCYFEDLDYGSRIGSSSPMYDVARTCKTAMKILRHRSRQRFFVSKGKSSSLAPLLSASLSTSGRPARNQVKPVS